MMNHPIPPTPPVWEPPGIIHGTRLAYQSYCRCDVCEAWMAKREHGTRANYDCGCRCDDCKGASRDYKSELRERRRATLAQREHGTYATYIAGCECDANRDRRNAQGRRNNHRRRARKRDAFVEDVNDVEIFERDAYKCQICGEKTLRSKKAPHPRSPSLDHIIPLSRGGLHERSNCVCAHLGCNNRKNNRHVGQQLALLP